LACGLGNGSEADIRLSDSMGEMDWAEDLDNDVECLIEFGVSRPSLLPARFVVERVKPSPRVLAGLLDVCPFIVMRFDEPAELVLDPSSRFSANVLLSAFSNPGFCCSSATPIQ
jgi:hypothetical protein